MATMRLAEHCGIRVPPMRLLQTERGDILLLRRFDREKTEAGYVRHGYLSALSVMSYKDTEPYRHSYLDFVDQLRSIFPKSWTREQGEELFRRLVFNILSRNIDDHARNHGILLFGQRMELSPAFDITPTITEAGYNSRFNMAMNLGPDGSVATWENVLAGAAHFGLNQEKAKQAIFEIAGKISAWREIFSETGVSEEDTEKFRWTFDSSIREEALR
jgi:serine/threonine-protein kinase HipA